MTMFLAKVKNSKGKIQNITIEAQDGYEAKKKAEEHGKLKTMRLIV